MRISTFQENCIYKIQSYASANTLYFEDKLDHQLFFEKIDYFLGGMIEIIDYIMIPTGWAMIIRTRSAVEIINAYNSQRKKSQKELKKNLIDTGLMVSEHFRFAISHFVKHSNFQKGRHGSKIHSKMEKRILETDMEFMDELDKIKALKLFCDQVESRYQANLEYYDEESLGGDWSYVRRVKGGNKVAECVMEKMPDIFVLRQWIKQTITTHQPRYS